MSTLSELWNAYESIYGIYCLVDICKVRTYQKCQLRVNAGPDYKGKNVHILFLKLGIQVVRRTYFEGEVLIFY